MISVIIVSLNTKDDFLETIKSIISQTKKIEIIVVDGSSTDGTIEVINRYSNFFDKIIIEKDEGIYFAMNKGIRSASKEWVYFLNSGDIFFNNKTIENITEILQQNKEVDVVVGNSLVKRKNYYVKSPRLNINNYRVNSCFSHQSTFTKRYLLNLYPFDTKFKYSSDFDFYLKLFKLKKKFIYIDQLISINKDGGISDRNKIEVFLEFKKIIIKQNKNFFNVLKINFIIFFNLMKQIVKFLIPNSITEKIIYLLEKKNKN
jgi:glycosyltransferase involved in cell wall biosynthesis